VLNLSGLVVKSASLVDGFLIHDIGNWDYALAAVLVPFLSLSILMLVRRYRSSIDPIDRNRTMYLITGWSVLLIISYVTPFTPSLAGLPTDHFGNLGNALLIAYAISRFHLLDIRLVARRGLTYAILTIAVVGIASGAVLIGREFSPQAPTSTVVLFATVLALLFALIATPLRAAIQTRVDRLFYRGTYDSRQALLSFSSKMGNILNLEELAKEMLPAMANALDIKETALIFQSSADADFAVRFAHPEGESTLKENLRLNGDSPIVTWLDKEDLPLNPAQIDTIPEFKGLWQTEKEQLTGSDIGFLHPIKSRGKLIGILALGTKSSGGPFSHEDLSLVSSIANQAGIIVENAQLFTQATYRATTDELTRLHNHRNFHERLEQEIARGSRFGTTFSLIMLDLDLFKAYNDIYGHLAGDQLLRKVGQAIENSVRAIDLAFRYGGEEFTVLLPETRLDDAYRVAERIRKTIETRASFREMPVTASLGIASWPNDGVMKEEIISRADAALYRAKQTGRNRTCLSSDVLKPETAQIGAELEAQPRALSIIYALAATVDAKDHYTYGHSRKVSEYAVALAEALKLGQDRVDTIRAGGLLHDIGKLGVPDSILTKPGPLDDDEWEPIKSHPELGVEILKRVIDLVNCLPAILHHHEHYDGSGYPRRLKRDSIPLEARILGIADAYDAITSPRPYRAQLPSEQAIAELKRCAGTQFDPELVETFIKVIQPTQVKSLDPGVKPTGDAKP
jgi:diguanylate cyclase (GGDEF)-like protein/putative nucleotidyltransferase with HDIG domain